MSPEVTIVIRTFNEQKHLNALFDAIDRQSLKSLETIVVDSGSFDHTRMIAKDRADNLIRIDSHDFTFGYSLNVGIEAARGELIAIISAHTIPTDEFWLEQLIAPLRDGSVAMTYGRQVGLACSKFSEAEDFERLYGPVARQEISSRLTVNNANSAIKRALWEQYPFDEKLTGLEDIDWARHWMERGMLVEYRPSAVIQHIHEESWRQIRHRYYREAVAWRSMGLKSRRTALRDICSEMLVTLDDVFRAFSSKSNPVGQRLNLSQRLREILYFRIHKNIGALSGIFAFHPLETREEQESILFDRTAEAVVINAPGNASLETVKIPALKPGEVLIQVAHVAICATDLEIFDGRLGYFQNGLGKFPIVPGHEFSGQIAETGQKVDGLSVGQPVVAECIQSCGSCFECRAGNQIGCAERTELGVLKRDGAYANYVVVPSRFVHPLPDEMDLRRASLCEPLAVILKALRRVKPLIQDRQADINCAVVGVGPLGHMCAKVMRYKGFATTGFDRNPARRALLQSSGIPVSADLTELSQFNLIVEITGDPEVLDQALRNSPANATILTLGLPYGERPFSFESIAAYDKTVTGSVGSTKADFDAAIDLLPELDLDAYFQSPLPLREFERAWSIYRKAEAFKIILDVDHFDDFKLVNKLN